MRKLPIGITTMAEQHNEGWDNSDEVTRNAAVLMSAGVYADDIGVVVQALRRYFQVATDYIDRLEKYERALQASFLTLHNR